MIDLDFTGKSALVTGASRGIGRAIAETLLTRNAEVMVTSTGEVPEWCAQYPKCTHVSADFKNQQSLEKLLEKVDTMQTIDILINNAGIHKPEAAFEINDESWRYIFAVNLDAPMAIMRAVTARMKSQKRGRIVNIGSIAGFVSKPGSGAYAASKAALAALTRSIAVDMGPCHVQVNTLCPGHTQTDMVTSILSEQQQADFQKSIPLGRFAAPEEIANFALFLCSDLNTYITGQTVTVDGGVVIQ